MRKLITDVLVGDRFRRDLGDLSSLSESMRRHGQLTPITVTPDNRLVAGHRRIEALKLLGELAVEVHVVSNLTDAVKLIEAERDENTCRKAMTGSELSDLAARLAEIKRETVKPGNPDFRNSAKLGRIGERVDESVGRALGVGKSTAQDLIRIGEAAQSDDVAAREAGQRAQAQLDAGRGVQAVAKELREALAGNPDDAVERQAAIDRRRQDKLWRNLAQQAAGLALAIPHLKEGGAPRNATEAAEYARDLRKLRTVISQTIDFLEGKATP